jgi:hypothetical protein
MHGQLDIVRSLVQKFGYSADALESAIEARNVKVAGYLQSHQGLRSRFLSEWQSWIDSGLVFVQGVMVISTTLVFSFGLSVFDHGKIQEEWEKLWQEMVNDMLKELHSFIWWLTGRQKWN